MEFDWDEAKHQRSLRERHIGFDLAALLFAGPVFVVEDDRRAYGERRMIAHGYIGDRRFVCVYTDRERDGRLVRWVISLRKANQRDIRRIHVP